MLSLLGLASISFFHQLITGDSQVDLGQTALAFPLPQEHYRICPLPKCKSCPSVEELRAPGIGFALETSHGAAVVRLHDGSHHNIALVEGDPSYVALMNQLATGPMNRVPDHFTSNWEKLQYAKLRAQRLANKLIGRPATPETAILASMISKLVESTQKWLGDEQTIVAAVLSSPDRIRLTDEEIDDIFDHLRIRNLMNVRYSLYPLYSTSAAYAGYDKGLCQNYTDAYACERDEFNFPPQRVLHLDFNVESLSGTIKSLQSVNDGSVDETFIDTSLGLKDEYVSLSTTAQGNSDRSEYWVAVSDRIRKLVLSFKRVFLPQMTVLLLTGPEARNERFQAAIKTALHDLVDQDDVLRILDAYSGTTEDQERWHEVFSFATARGAAEMAKRKQEGPVSCAQTDECRRRRESVHNERADTLVSQKSGFV